jgi:hypothetical protein
MGCCNMRGRRVWSSLGKRCRSTPPIFPMPGTGRRLVFSGGSLSQLFRGSFQRKGSAAVGVLPCRNIYDPVHLLIILIAVALNRTGFAAVDLRCGW